MKIKQLFHVLRTNMRRINELNIAHKISINAEKLIRDLEDSFNNQPKGAKRLCIALFAQTIRLHKCIIIICQKGFDNEVAILTRSLIENISYLIFITEKDYEERTKLYQHSRTISVYEAIMEFNAHVPQGGKKVDEVAYKKYKLDALSYFRSKYGNTITEQEIKEKYTLRPRNAAEQLEKGDIKTVLLNNYNKFYRHASLILHGEDPFSFIKSEGGKISLRRSNTGRLSSVCIRTSIVLVLYSMESLNKLFGNKKKYNIDILFGKIGKLLKRELK